MNAPESFAERVNIFDYIKRLDLLLKGVQSLEIEFVGEGETLISPTFTPLFLWAISHNYKVVIQTNLFANCIDVFEKAIQSCPPEKRINVTVGTSYHLGAYFDLFPDTIEKVRNRHVYEWYGRLAKTGVRLGRIETPMTPICLRDSQLDKDFEYMKFLGGHPAPVALVGNYKGKHYPEAYTEEESKLLFGFFNKWREDSEKIVVRTDKWNAQQIPYILHQIPLQHRLCYKRVHSAEIMIDGRIRYCQSYPYWWYAPNPGHLFSDPLPSPLFLDAPVPCPMEKCGCETIGIRHSLLPQSINIKNYFHAYYLDQNQPEIANLFGEKKDADL